VKSSLANVRWISCEIEGNPQRGKADGLAAIAPPDNGRLSTGRLQPRDENCRDQAVLRARWRNWARRRPNSQKRTVVTRRD